MTNLGAPLSDWLLIFKRADGKPVVGTSGTKTLADGWYDFKLRPGIYQIQLCAPGVFMINGVSVKGHELKYTRIHFVTKTETLNLDVSGLAPYVPKQR